jgi:predicted small lipoprotein YifL
MRYYNSKLLLAVAVVASVATVALTGCGQTGPLYMPPESVPVPPAMSETGSTPGVAPTAPASTTENASNSATTRVGPPSSEAP